MSDAARPKRNWAAILPVAIFGVLVVAFLIGLLRGRDDSLPSVYIDQPAPPVPSEPLPGYAIVGPEDIVAPGLKLVNFWASWCPPCRAEHPNLMRLAEEEGWSIIGVNKSDRVPNAQGFLRELGNPYSVIGADPDGRGSIEWGVYGLPETFLVDGEGNIRFRFPGAVTKRVWENRFLPVIRALEAEAG